MKRKTDGDTISAEDHELDYMKKKYGIGRRVMLALKAIFGTSRKKIMKYLQESVLR